MATRIRFRELEDAWERDHRELEQRLQKLGQLPPDDQRKLEAYRDEGAIFKVDSLYTKLWEEYGLKKADQPRRLMLSQRGSQPDDLTEEEIAVAVVWHRLRRAGYTEPGAEGFDEALAREKARFDEYKSHYVEAAKALAARVRTGEQDFIELELLDDTAEHLAATPYPGAQAVAAAERYRGRRFRRELLTSRELLELDVVPLEGAGIRAAAALALARRLVDAGLFRAVEQVSSDAEAGVTDLAPETIDRLEDYSRRQEERWPSPERADELMSRLFADPFDSVWERFVAAAHDFTESLTAFDVRYGGLSRHRAEALRGPALDVATLLSDRATATVRMIAASAERQIVDARKILDEPDVQRAYRARDWRGVVVETCPDLAGVDLSQIVELAEWHAILISWLATKVDNLRARHGELVDVAVIASGFSSDNPFREPTDADAAYSWDAISHELLARVSSPRATESRAQTPTGTNGSQTGQQPEEKPVFPAPPARVKLKEAQFPPPRLPESHRAGRVTASLARDAARAAQSRRTAPCRCGAC
jgi:hypothetical protein